jgi:hypothetical protein
MALTPDQIKQLRDYYADLEMDTSTIEKNLDEAAKNQKFLTEQSKLAAQHFNEASISAGGIASSLQDAVQELSKGNSFTKSALGSFRSLQSVASKFKYDMAGYSTMSKKEIERNITKIKQEKDNLELLIKKGRITGEAAEEAKNVIADSDTLLGIAKERLAEEIKIQQQMGLTGAVVDGIVGTLSKMGINSVFFDGIKEDMRDSAKSGGALKAMFTGIVGLGKGLGQALTDPLTILTFLISSGLKADKQVTDLARSLGIGKDQANGLRQNFVRYAASTGDAFITTSKLMEAQGELTNELGIAGKYTGKQTEDFTRLTKLMGLSASEAGKLARLSVINGTSIEDTTKSIIRGSAASQRSNKISIDQRTILKDVANLSAGILVKFQGNPEALGAAVVQARALGLTLEEVDKIGESLLNFESSIENELKAELITGKQLNLERARAAALTGDQATLMQEVSSQMGSLEEFQGLNIIAQKSLAEAFGLSRDEVSKMLIEQEKVNKLGDVSKMTLDEQLAALKAQGEPLDSVLYKQIQQQSAQEKFNQAIEKLSDMVGNLVAGPFGRLLDIIASIVSNTTALSSIMAIYIGKQVFSLSLATAAFLLARRTAKMTAVDAAAEAAKSAAKVPIIGGILAITAGLATFAALSGLISKADDMVSPGYGKRTLLSPEGAIKLNDNDTVIAGTNLGGGDKAVSPNINRDSINRPMQPSFNTSAITDAISALSNTVSGLVNRPQATPQFALHVDGRQLGTVVGQQMETGTAQNIYTGYKVA